MGRISRYILFFCMMYQALCTYGQVGDTILVYNLVEKTVDTILPVSFDPSISFDKTSSYTGTLVGSVPLSLSPPDTNLFSGSSFSDIERAELFFNVKDYPVRTAVKLFRYEKDSINGSCSGVLVHQNLVLTGAHCCFKTSWLSDSILAVPAYDNGMYHPDLPLSPVNKIYIFKSFCDKFINDIALLELKYPIGQKTGWIGMAFTTDSAFFAEKVFHKLSYPAIKSPFDPAKIYNGDTLYYNYGYIDILSPGFLGIKSTEAAAIPGQSGSSFIYTDHSDYYSVGVLNFSNKYRHYQISNDVFYQFKNIMDNYASLKPDTFIHKSIPKIYPNPLREGAAVLEFANPNAEIYMFSLFDGQGKLIYSLSGVSGTRVMIERKDLPAGLYFFTLSTGNIIHTGKLIIQ